MPTYRMAAPDGQTYQIDGPDGASDDQVREQIIKQNPHLGGSGGAAPTEPQQEWQRPPSEGVIGAGINRLKRGGQAVADAIYPAAPAPPKSWGQFAKDTALGIGGGLMEASSAITAPLGELVRPAGEALGRHMAMTPEEVDSEISRLQAEKSRMMGDKTIMAVSPNVIEQMDAQLDALRAKRSKSLEQQAYEKGNTVGMAAEILGGAAFGKPFKWRGPVASEAPAAAFMTKPMAQALREVPAPLRSGQSPIMDMQAIQPELVPAAPPARQIRRPFEEAPTAIEPQPTPDPYAIPKAAPEEPIPSAAEAAQARTGGQIEPRQPEPSPLVDAQGRTIRNTPEPGQGTAERLVSPPVDEAPLATLEQPRPLKEAGQIAEERTGGALPQQRKPIKFEEPEDAQLRLDQEAESGIERALRQGMEPEVPEGPTQRLIREGKSITGGSDAPQGRNVNMFEKAERMGLYEDVGWMTPEGKEVSHLGKTAPGRTYEFTHVEALENMGLGDDMTKAFQSGMVRYARAGNQLSVEVGVPGIDNAITYISRNGRNARGGVIVEITDPNGGMLASKQFDRPWQAIEYLKSQQTAAAPEARAADAAMNQQVRGMLADEKARQIRSAKPISGGSDAPIEQPLKSAREIGMRRKPKAEPKAPVAPESEIVETPTAPEPQQGPRTIRGSDKKTALTPDELESRLVPPTIGVPEAAGPNLVPLQPKGTMRRGWERVKASLPQELAVLRQRPNSPVITDMEHYHTRLAHGMKDVVDQPWWQDIKALDPDLIKDLEVSAVKIFKETGDLEKSIAEWPEALKEYIRFRNERLVAEQAARTRLGLEPPKELPGPYLPRMTNSELNSTVNIRQGESSQILQTSVRSAQEHRLVPTMREGELAGIEYVDPRNAILAREYNSLKVTSAEQLISGLKNRGLFDTAEAAAAVSPTKQAFPVRGLPGADVWYAPTQAEARFIAQNVTAAPRGITIPGVTSAKNLADLTMRNPNLLNPAPHVTKNMGLKAMLAQGITRPHTLITDVIEYKSLLKAEKAGQAVPREFQLFKEYMPHAQAEPAYATMSNELIREGLNNLIHKGVQTVGKLNKPSSNFIFKTADPGMRYSLFKKYIKQGMEPQEAANHTWIDLVRYSTRSELTDMWKSIPFNFFIPWRVGTYQSVAKAVLYHPLRTAMTIAAFDALREVRYRRSGRWTHVPWDYIEGPLVLGLENLAQGNAGQMTWEAMTNAAFGPGGEQTAKSLGRMLSPPAPMPGEDSDQDPATLMERVKDFLSTWWGISQIGESLTEGVEAFTKHGDPSKFMDAVLAALISERQVYKENKQGNLAGQAPHRVMEAIPESVLPKSRTLRAMEQERGQ